MFLPHNPPRAITGANPHDTGSGDHQPMENEMSTLTYDAAMSVVVAGLAKGSELEVAMSVAVVDASRELVAFGRQDGAALVSIDLAIKKAFTAKSFDMDTATIGSWTLPGEPIFGFPSSDNRFVTFAGGIPLTDIDGKVVGAVGASGGPLDIDLQVAEAAAATFNVSEGE